MTRPIATPSARISSITSLIVPFTEPIATTSVAASAADSSEKLRPRGESFSNSIASPGLEGGATRPACRLQVRHSRRNGPTIAPIELVGWIEALHRAVGRDEGVDLSLVGTLNICFTAW